MKPNPKKTTKTDYQTISLFLILGLLTMVFVFGLRWVLLTPFPRSAVSIIGVEGASK